MLHGDTILCDSSRKGQYCQITIWHKYVIFECELGRTALHRATNWGHHEVVDMLIRRKADVNLADKHGYTALMVGSERGQLDCVQLLVENKANLEEIEDNQDCTALTLACISDTELKDKLRIVKCLLRLDDDNDSGISTYFS